MAKFRDEQLEYFGEAALAGRGAPAAVLTADMIAPSTSVRRNYGLADRIASLDLAPDLAENIGSRRWFRGLATMLGLSAAAIAFWPGFSPVEAAPHMRLDSSALDEYRSQSIGPLALGADSGRHMAETGAVRPLAAAPERPQVELLATLAQGDGFSTMLQRAGVGAGDASRVLALVGGALPLDSIEPGTQVDLTLGRREQPGDPRPLKSLSFRARFDLALSVDRAVPGGPLSLTRHPIRVDDTPLRIQAQVGASLYRSARAAGAPASAVQAFLKALDKQGELDGKIRPGDTFDIIISHRRAATGESENGKLLFAGIERDGKPKVQLMRWGADGNFYEASGVGEQKNGLVRPVPGRETSGFGMRRHPILGYVRMHAGEDFAASYGTPIRAVTDGRVVSAGRAGGCGNAVKLNHGGGLQTRYCHMSRMAVSAGQAVKRGQVIGYVGATGLATGPHLHYEVYRNGRPVNPETIKFVTRAQLAGADLKQFRTELAQLKRVEPGAALAELAPTQREQAASEPQREIDKLDSRQTLN
ncbi:M23 family metallopeptidase [Qipengyuania algicida]|nr:M23 family metallopeptidase [Qipengyuania algicida]